MPKARDTTSIKHRALTLAVSEPFSVATVFGKSFLKEVEVQHKILEKPENNHIHSYILVLDSV